MGTSIELKVIPLLVVLLSGVSRFGTMLFTGAQLPMYNQALGGGFPMGMQGMMPGAMSGVMPGVMPGAMGMPFMPGGGTAQQKNQTQCKQMCTGQPFQPVCGIDQKTYNSECALLCMGVALFMQGPCPMNIFGSNSAALPSKCLPICKQMLIPSAVCPVECLKSPSANVPGENEGYCLKCVQKYGMYPPTQEFVCGKDGRTYANPCFADCNPDDALPIQCLGQCPCKSTFGRVNEDNVPANPYPCPMVFEPVCGIDQRTYANPCLATSFKVVVLCPGSCPCDTGLTDPLCHKKCTQIAVPVCGADGRTYRNKCFAACSKHVAFPIMKEGVCDDSNNPKLKEPVGAVRHDSNPDLSSDFVCTKMCSHQPFQLEPVCGKDLLTYPNLCMAKCKFQKAFPLACNSSCGDPTCDLSNTVIEKEFERPTAANPKTLQCVFNCSQNNNLLTQMNPVCGKNNVTYMSKCAAECVPEASPIACDTACPCLENRDACLDRCMYKPSPPMPICGVNGKTYPNLCQYMCDWRVASPMLRIGPCLPMDEPANKLPYAECVKKCPMTNGHDLAVCGADNNTHPTPCHAVCSNALPLSCSVPCEECNQTRSVIKHDHQMMRGLKLNQTNTMNPTDTCPQTVEPVCGHDNQEYVNICKFRAMTNSYLPKCQHKCPCDATGDVDLKVLPSGGEGSGQEGATSSSPSPKPENGDAPPVDEGTGDANGDANGEVPPPEQNADEPPKTETIEDKNKDGKSKEKADDFWDDFGGGGKKENKDFKGEDFGNRGETVKPPANSTNAPTQPQANVTKHQSITNKDQPKANVTSPQGNVTKAQAITNKAKAPENVTQVPTQAITNKGQPPPPPNATKTVTLSDILVNKDTANATKNATLPNVLVNKDETTVKSTNLNTAGNKSHVDMAKIEALKKLLKQTKAKA